jgi:CHAT domain-containing protein
MTQNNLGNAYCDRILGDKAQNLEKAIASYEAALQVRKRDALPQDWAMTQNNLGLAYLYRILGDKAQNLEESIAAYTAALQVLTRDAFPQNHAKTLLNLGIAYQDAQRFPKAYTTFKDAIESVELLRGEIVSGDDTKRKQAEEWNQLYLRMVEVCLELENLTEAIEYAERSKTRNLVELILDHDLNTIFPSEVVTQLEQLQDEIASGQYQLQNGKAENATALAQHLQQLRQQRNDLQNRYLPIGYGFKLDQFQATLDEHTTVVEWYITNTGFETFIITCNSLQRLKIANATEQRNAVVDWVNNYLNAYSQTKDEWENSLASRLSRLAKILHLEDILTLVSKTCSRLVLIPYIFLHLLPIQALPLSQNGKTVCLLDHFPNGVSYAPSCQLLLQAQQRKRPHFTHLFAIQNPTNDLAYTDLEVQAITDYFNPIDILKNETATLTAINEANLNAIHCAHFSCHGYFNLRNAGKSALILANALLASIPANPDTERYLSIREGETHDLNQCLTLDAILRLNLERCRLVTLSACETGLIDINNTSDEYIGLPSGFLVAGSPSVVSSLWRVNDLSTALLMIKFYQNLKSGLTIAVALNQAQKWLRDATTSELEKWINNLNLNENLTQQIRKKLRRRAPSEQPFHSPYYWAAFCAIGQ